MGEKSDKQLVTLLIVLLVLALLAIVLVIGVTSLSSKENTPNNVEQSNAETNEIEDFPVSNKENVEAELEENNSDPSQDQKSDVNQVQSEDPPLAKWIGTTKSDSGVDDEEVKLLILSENQEIYISGNFEGNFNIGKGTERNDGKEDYFVARYSKDGTVKQVITPEDGNNIDVVEDVVIYGDEIYLGGYSNSNLDFGKDEDNDEIILENQGEFDFFIAKYNEKGNSDLLITSISKSGNRDDYARTIAVDAQGIYMIGETQSDLRFGNGVKVDNNGGTDFFIATFERDGEARSSLSYATEGKGDDFLVDYHLDLAGNVYFAGYSKSTIDFGNNVILQNKGEYDFFIVKYSSSGQPIWVRSSAGSSGESNDIIVDIEADETGLYVAGYSKSSLDFGSNVAIENTGGFDLFIVKYDFDGNAKWVISPKGESDDKVVDIELHAGSLYVTGTTDSNLNFGTKRLQNKGREDLFIAKYQGNTLFWLTSPSNANQDDYPLKLQVTEEAVYLGGNTESSLDFGNGASFRNQGDNDFFVVKFSDTGIPLWLVTSEPSQIENKERFQNILVEESGTSEDILVDFQVVDNALYIIGNTEGNLDFGEEIFLTNDGKTDFFLVKYE